MHVRLSQWKVGACDSVSLAGTGSEVIEDEKGALSQEQRSFGPALLGNKQPNKLSPRSMWPPLTSDSITSLKMNGYAQVYLVAISYL